jgi:DNA repair photolyase
MAAMRWSGQQVLDTGVGQDAALPGLRGLLRTVRPPEFAGTVFHEVEARSVLNRVSGAAALPFGWTVNPYRGCSHACVYCLAGPTGVLMADGRTRPIADLRVGDAVLGTEVVDGRRRYVPTTVLAHWSTRKPAHRVRLRNGTEIVASGEHRFLTDAGWRHVTGGWCRSGRRPRLRPGSALLGPGPAARSDRPANPAVARTVGYRQGYLCGLVGGDTPAAFPSEQLELEALGRAHHFLALAGGADRSRLRSGARSGPAEPGRVPPPLQAVVRWPGDPGEDWCAGFLGGVADARGAVVAGELRIRHTDNAIIGRVAGALHRLGFRFAVTTAGGTAGPAPEVRLRGGPAALLRFLQLADPAVSRLRDPAGAPVRGGAGLAVESVRSLGVTVPMYDITTGTGDFVAEGVVSHNCFARSSHTYLDLDAGADFDAQIVVKVNAARVLDRELRAPRWVREPVAMGTNTDPYQRAEGRYRLMPGIIDALARSGTPFSVLTKGTVLTRDLPRLAAAAEDVRVGLGVSIALLDRALQVRLEPGTPTPAARLDLVRRITDAGLPCGVVVAPVLPLLTDSAAALDELLARIAAAGASGATVMALHLRRGTREWFCPGWAASTPPSCPGTSGSTGAAPTSTRPTAGRSPNGWHRCCTATAWPSGRARCATAHHRTVWGRSIRRVSR